MDFGSTFEIVSRLGIQKKRKFSSTYLVRDKSTDQKLVLKVVEHSKKNELAKQQLSSESKFSFDLCFLPKVVHFHSSEKKSVLVLEYKEGVPLDQYFSSLKRKERILFLKSFFDKIVPLFEELKTKNIAHCDIKPSNFIVDKLGQIHLIDFGLAIKYSEKNDRKLIFPLGYAAPELILNQLDLVNEQTDFYALGILIWRLFSGNIPLYHPNPSIFTNLQLNHPLPTHYSISKELQLILEKMTKKHSFAIPPNRMELEKVCFFLKEARDFRSQSIIEISKMIQSLPERKRWF